MGMASDSSDASEDPSALGTLVAGVAHEINNPISYVLGNLGELEAIAHTLRATLDGYRHALAVLAPDDAVTRVADLEAKLRDAGGLELVDELVADASEGARRIRDLVRDLHSLSHPSRPAAAPFSLESLLEQTLRLVARPLAARAELVRELEAQGLTRGDPARLSQVCLNLLRNAIDACEVARPDGAPHRITVRTRDGAHGVRLEVEDTGPGVAAEHARKIFSPFFTTKEPGHGTGLGLYMSRRIVREHGGSITCERAQNGGARFVVELPGSD
jgi:two-component system sensor histidine kinase HupT/HoxJ